MTSPDRAVSVPAGPASGASRTAGGSAGYAPLEPIFAFTGSFMKIRPSNRKHL